MGGEEKWDRSPEEEEEALSLSDLPVDLMEEEETKPLLSSQDNEAQGDGPNSEDFDFGQLGGCGSKSTSSEMCAADDIFFQGQILPFRLSVSSENGAPYNSRQQEDSSNPSRCVSRSESMDRSSNGGFVSFSSRSSSTSSHYSSSGNSGSSVASAAARPRILNQFYAYPSPKPQIKVPNAPLGSTGANRTRKSSIWETLRLGLVRAPEIELHDLKARSSVSRNSSTSSSNSSKMEKQRDKKTKDKKRSSSGLFSGCDCSVGAIQPVQLNNNNIVVIKSCKKNDDRHGNGNSSSKISSGENEDNCKQKEEPSMEEKLQELKMKKKKKMMMSMMMKEKQKGKQTMSRHRTFEWIKELSHASFVDHEEREGLDS